LAFLPGYKNRIDGKVDVKFRQIPNYSDSQIVCVNKWIILVIVEMGLEAAIVTEAFWERKISLIHNG
jgi:hypothetical protein